MHTVAHTSTRATSEPIVLAKSRDAGNTRQLLLQAARRRFARDGYSSTTVRDIAADAGVNVALINRYFESKEGLFEACLARAAEDLGRVDEQSTGLDRVVQKMIEQVTDASTGELDLQLLLLLRSSGDERADEIRRATLQSFAEGIAGATGWRPGDAGGEEILLRAQLAIAASLGFVLLRTSSMKLEPLASASQDDLTAPLTDLLSHLLAR